MLTKTVLRHLAQFGMIACVVAFVAIFTIKMLVATPELKLSEQALVQNQVILNNFGNIKSITPLPNDMSYTSSTDSYIKFGSYGFLIQGLKKAGTIRAQWRSENGKFGVNEIVDTSDGKESILWKAGAN